MPRPKRPKQYSTSKTAIARAERDREAMARRAGGMCYSQIAKELGMSNKSVAYKAVVRVLEQWQAETAESAEVVRDIELRRLDEMLAGLWPKAKKGDPQAIDRVLKIMDRRAKFLGLDAPERTELSIAPADQERVRVILERVKELRQLPDAEFAALPAIDTEGEEISDDP